MGLDDFSLFGLKPVFKFGSGRRFLHADTYPFINEENESIALTPLELILYLLNKNEEQYLSKYTALLFYDNLYDFAKEHISEAEITVPPFGIGRPKIKAKTNSNNYISEEHDEENQDAENSDVLILLRTILGFVEKKYLHPLAAIEEEGAALFMLRSGSTDNVPDAQPLLSQLRYQLYVLVYGQMTADSEDAVKQLNHDREEAKAGMRYLNFYVTDLTASPAKEGVYLKPLIDTSNDPHVTDAEVDAAMQIFIKTQVLDHALARLPYFKKKKISKSLTETVKKKNKKEPIEAKDTKSSNTYLVSGHYIDQTLLGKKPKPGEQLALELTKDTIQKVSAITKRTIEESMEWINRHGLGIRLSSSEYKIIDCLCESLQDKSQITNRNSDDFYTGNAKPKTITYGGKDEAAPHLSVTLHELAKKFKGDSVVSGEDYKTVWGLIVGLAEDPNKRFLIKYVDTKTKGKVTVRDTIEEFHPLLQYKWHTREKEVSSIVVSSKKEIIITMDPIFRHSIASKYLRLPTNSEMIKAAQTRKIPEICYKLRDYLLREVSSNRLNPEIGIDALYWKIAEDYMRESRKQTIFKYFNQSVDTLKRLRIIEELQIIPNSTGGEKIVFTLNKNWAELNQNM